jgi:hypothetical protein
LPPYFGPRAEEEREVLLIGRGAAEHVSAVPASARTPAEIIEIEAKLEAVETYMRESGLYSTEAILP